MICAAIPNSRRLQGAPPISPRLRRQDPHLVATDFFPLIDHPTEGKIRNMKVAATWSESSVEPTRLAPRLNEHGAEILREAGFSADEVATLVRDGVTKAAAMTPQD